MKYGHFFGRAITLALYPTIKMTVFCAIFEVNRSIGKLWDLLGHFDKKDMFFTKRWTKFRLVI